MRNRSVSYSQVICDFVDGLECPKTATCVVLSMWQKINQKRSYPHTKNGRIENFFTPFPASSYENRETRDNNIFRINRACPFYCGRKSVFETETS
jgi:hypothetical protein